MADKDVQLMAHLMRRAGFGVSRETLDELVEKSYNETVDHLLEMIGTRLGCRTILFAGITRNILG